MGGAQAHVRLHLLHLGQLDLGLEPELRLAAAGDERAGHGVAAQRDERNRSDAVDRLDQVEHQAVAEIGRLDQGRLSGPERCGMPDHDLGESGVARIAHRGLLGSLRSLQVSRRASENSTTPRFDASRTARQDAPPVPGENRSGA